jgi:hypothetical protein
MKRSKINKIKKQNNWRQGRPDAHCDICVSIDSYQYNGGFGTRLQKTCKTLKINTDGVTVCDQFKK